MQALPVRSEVAAPEIEEHAVLLLDDRRHRQGDAGIRHVDDHVDLVFVEPFARDAGPDVRLVLVIARR